MKNSALSLRHPINITDDIAKTGRCEKQKNITWKIDDEKKL